MIRVTLYYTAMSADMLSVETADGSRFVLTFALGIWR